VLEKAGWKVGDVDLWEVNEAFACVAMFAMKDIGIPHERINVHGGATALGHPIGASGTRIIVTLVNALKQKGGKRGVASLCIGGGEATAVAVELVCGGAKRCSVGSSRALFDQLWAWPQDLRRARPLELVLYGAFLLYCAVGGLLACRRVWLFRGPKGSKTLIHHLALTYTPDVGFADESSALVDANPAPAVAASVDPANHPGLRPIADTALRFRASMDRARIAGLDHCGAAVAEQGGEHPPPLTVGVLDQPPVLVPLDDPDREVAPLVQPGAGKGARGPGAHHRLAAGYRRPVGRLPLLRGSRGGRGNDQDCSKRAPDPHHAPVRILSTSCLTVGTKPFE
jgi:hypothetical protein